MIYGADDIIAFRTERGPPMVIWDELTNPFAKTSLKNVRERGYKLDIKTTTTISRYTLKNHKQRFCKKQVTHFVSISQRAAGSATGT